MSVRVMALVFDFQGVTPTEKLVLLALADYAADDGSQVYPSITTVIKKTCLCERAVRIACRTMESRGLLESVTRSGKSTVYTIAVDTLTVPRHLVPPGIKCTPAPDAPLPRHLVPPTGACDAPNPSINHQIETSIIKGAVLTAFWETFLKAYPSRGSGNDRGITPGRKKFEAEVKRGTSPEILITGAETYAKNCILTDRAGTQYVKQIPAWFNQRVWEEEIPDYTPSTNGHTNGKVYRVLTPAEIERMNR